MFSQGCIIGEDTRGLKVMDKFISCHPKDKTNGLEFICGVSQLCLGMEEEKLLGVIWQGVRGMTLRSCILPDTRAEYRSSMFLLPSLG